MKDHDYMLVCESVSKDYKIWRDTNSRLKAPIWSLVSRAFARSRVPNPYYRTFSALTNVSFRLKRGESIGIIGRNGSGKSTLLQILAGTLQPSNGSVESKGRVAALLELGSGFNPEFSGRENVYLYASILGLSRRETNSIFDSIVEFSELEAFIDQPLRTYSSGMMIRLAFSVRIHLEPEVLIIDEALAVGDFYFVQKCTRYIRDFVKDKTLVLVTHDLSAVQNLCGRCIWLKEGEVQYDGTPKDAVERYLAYYQPGETTQAAKSGDNSEDVVRIETKTVDNDELLYDQRNAAKSQLPPNEWEVVLLDEPENGYGTGEGEIVSCRLKDKEGRTLTGVVGGERVILSLTARSQVRIQQPIIGFNLKDRLGQYIFGDNTYLSNKGHELVLEPNSTLTATFEFRMPILHPGEYAFTAALAKGTQETHAQIHWIHEALLIRSESPATHIGICGIPMFSIRTEIN